MSEHSIFFDEWQACLRAHYQHVVRIQDEITEETLRIVLLQSGMTEEDLRALAEEALSDDFPDDDSENAPMSE